MLCELKGNLSILGEGLPVLCDQTARRCCRQGENRIPEFQGSSYRPEKTIVSYPDPRKTSVSDPDPRSLKFLEQT
jgi:hypothetical protein